ncbi:MAG: molybdenum cofactor biosynthesis protein MoaE [Propionibacteriaceae bacterium]|jgi:molybdopterin synthase catalytic subunit|nr:molybdenum cofactor biosynthesis protein MoaE [Propionibacteriaceae bacterium]
MTARLMPAVVGPAPIDPAALDAAVRSAAAGAVVTFAGTVRDHDGGRTVTALVYEAHPDAAAWLDRLLAEWAAAHPDCLAAAAAHRTGALAIGEVAFAASVAAAHRAEAFAGCADLVDRVKAGLPVWKDQAFADGTRQWVNAP